MTSLGEPGERWDFTRLSNNARYFTPASGLLHFRVLSSPLPTQLSPEVGWWRTCQVVEWTRAHSEVWAQADLIWGSSGRFATVSHLPMLARITSMCNLCQLAKPRSTHGMLAIVASPRVERPPSVLPAWTQPRKKYSSSAAVLKRVVAMADEACLESFEQQGVVMPATASVL